MSLTFNKTGVIDLNNGVNQNLILNSSSKVVSHLESGNEYISINVGQSYIDVPDGTTVTFSFDLEIKIMKQHATYNTYFALYNSNNKGPKYFNTARLDSQVYDASQVIGNTYKKRVSATVVLRDRDNATLPNNYLEFYAYYGSGNVFKISNLKCELGSVATPWIPNITDSDYGENCNFGYIETGDKLKIFQTKMEAKEFIEY